MELEQATKWLEDKINVIYERKAALDQEEEKENEKMKSLSSQYEMLRHNFDITYKQKKYYLNGEMKILWNILLVALAILLGNPLTLLIISFIGAISLTKEYLKQRKEKISFTWKDIKDAWKELGEISKELNLVKQQISVCEKRCKEIELEQDTILKKAEILANALGDIGRFAPTTLNPQKIHEVVTYVEEAIGAIDSPQTLTKRKLN